MSEKMKYSQPHLFLLGDEGESAHGTSCSPLGYSAADDCTAGGGALDCYYNGNSAAHFCNDGYSPSPEYGCCYDGYTGGTPE